MKNDGRDELDQRIDLALAAYSSAEPMDGLEARVMRRIHAEPPKRRRWWLIAVPALAAAGVAGVLLWQPQPVPPPVAVFRSPAPPVLVSVPVPRPQPVRKVAPRKRQGLPKLERFPSQVPPLTPEERVMVAWVARDPAQAQKTMQEFRKRLEGPIVIAPIDIKPLKEGETR